MKCKQAESSKQKNVLFFVITFLCKFKVSTTLQGWFQLN